MMTAAMAHMRVMMKMDRKRMISHKTRRRLFWLVLPGVDAGVDRGLVGLSSVKGRRVYFRGWGGGILISLWMKSKKFVERISWLLFSERRNGEAQGRRGEMRA
jgi:hypothetical protein